MPCPCIAEEDWQIEGGLAASVENHAASEQLFVLEGFL
jgi:hypothetical protein